MIDVKSVLKLGSERYLEENAYVLGVTNNDWN